MHICVICAKRLKHVCNVHTSSFANILIFNIYAYICSKFHARFWCREFVVCVESSTASKKHANL